MSTCNTYDGSLQPLLPITRLAGQHSGMDDKKTTFLVRWFTIATAFEWTASLGTNPTPWTTVPGHGDKKRLTRSG